MKFLLSSWFTMEMKYQHEFWKRKKKKSHSHYSRGQFNKVPIVAAHASPGLSCLCSTKHMYQFKIDWNQNMAKRKDHCGGMISRILWLEKHLVTGRGSFQESGKSLWSDSKWGLWGCTNSLPASAANIAQAWEQTRHIPTPCHGAFAYELRHNNASTLRCIRHTFPGPGQAVNNCSILVLFQHWSCGQGPVHYSGSFKGPKSTRACPFQSSAL